jgi:hypothetical protein
MDGGVKTHVSTLSDRLIMAAFAVAMLAMGFLASAH